MAYTQTQVHDDIIALLTQVAYCPHWVHDDSMILPANVCWWSLSSSQQQIVLVCHSCGRLGREREKVPLENVMCIPSILVVYVIWPVILLYVSAGYVVSSTDKEDWVPWIALGLQIRAPRSTNHKQWIILTIAQFSLSVFIVIIFMFCGLGSSVLLFLQTQQSTVSKWHLQLEQQNTKEFPPPSVPIQ